MVGGKRGPGSWTAAGHEGAQVCGAREGLCGVSYLLHPDYGLGQAQRIMTVFPAVEGECVIAWLGDA